MLGMEESDFISEIGNTCQGVSAAVSRGDPVIGSGCRGGGHGVRVSDRHRLVVDSWKKELN